MAQSSQDYPITQAVTAKSSESAFLQTALSPLDIPELLCMIICDLAPQDLLSAARVCREWSEPALDQIWHSIDSLAPLLRLVGPMRRPKYEWEFVEDIQSADWSRYAFYAPRIRDITLHDSNYRSRVSDQAFQAFVDHIPSHLSLPRPSSINAFMLSRVQVIPLISQSLRKLNVGEVAYFSTVHNCTVAMQAMVSAAAMLDEPCLEQLQVVSSFGDVTLLEALKMCLAKHRSKISTLMARLPFDTQTWNSIFALPALQTLDIAPFDTTAPRPSEIVSMVRTLVASQPRLNNLQLDLPFPRERPLDNALYSQLIHELMGLRNLETLALYVVGFLSLSESDVRKMGASWPNIRDLQFHSDRNWLSKTPLIGITIQTDISLLSSFLRYLPFLEELRIQFTCNPPLTAHQDRLPAPAFRMLDLGASPSPKAPYKDVAAYLAAVLPRSADVRYIEKPPIWKWIFEALDSQRAESEPTGAEIDT